MNDATHFTTDHNNAACGRDKHRRASGVTGLYLSTRAYPVDCALCQRTKAYKAAKAADDALVAAKPAPKTFAKGDKIKGYGSTAVVKSTFDGNMVIVWDHDGRSGVTEMASSSFTKIS